MADPDTGEIDWYNADPRAILPLDDSFHVPRSLARVLRSERYTIRSDTAFEEVIRACAHDRTPGNRTWISEEIIAAYTRLHEAGHAHSVEAWAPIPSPSQGEGRVGVRARDDNQTPTHPLTPSLRGRGVLVGGLYGVHIGSAFFGESMFARPDLGGSNSSKVCLVHLMQRLRAAGFTLVDTQFHNPHLEQFGLIEIPRKEYLRRLERAVEKECSWPFTPSPSGRGLG